MHPEGGYYKETYRAKERVNLTHFNGERSIATNIYYLLKAKNFSAWHRIKSDETWHFYDGDDLKIHIINTQGELITHFLGKENAAAHVQLVVPANCWFSAELADPKDDFFAFVGCTVAPGFDFQDFELGEKDQLIALYPQHREIICRLIH